MDKGIEGIMDLDLSLTILGSILESDNSAVSTFGRKLPIQGFQKKNSVNLINLLTQLIMVCCSLQLFELSGLLLHLFR